MDEISTGESKTRPLLSGTLRCSAGARKLPHEGNKDGGLGTRLPSPYNKVKLYICPIIYIVFVTSVNLCVSPHTLDSSRLSSYSDYIQNKRFCR